MNKMSTKNEQTNCNQQLGIPKMPIQEWPDNLYPLDQALKNGTIFPELNMEFFLGGVKHGE